MDQNMVKVEKECGVYYFAAYQFNGLKVSPARQASAARQFAYTIEVMLKTYTHYDNDEIVIKAKFNKKTSELVIGVFVSSAAYISLEIDVSKLIATAKSIMCNNSPYLEVEDESDFIIEMQDMILIELPFSIDSMISEIDQLIAARAKDTDDYI